MANTNIILKTENITKKFGGLKALENVNIEVEKGKVVGLIGPNGAGKTTLFNVITGFYKPDGGRVLLEDKNITGLSPHQICKLGVTRTWQILKPLSTMTVEDSLKVSLYNRNKGPVLGEKLEKLLDFFDLKKIRNRLCGRLTVLELKLVSLAQALATEPKILLIDEIGAGLNPLEQDEITDFINNINKNLKIGILWVEHVMRMIMKGSKKIYVLNFGKIISCGPPKKICKDIEVKKAYLGEVYG